MTLPLDGDLTEADRQKDLADKHRRAALRSSVIQELRQQYSDAPEEIRDRQDFQTERESREEQHRLVSLDPKGLIWNMGKVLRVKKQI